MTDAISDAVRSDWNEARIRQLPGYSLDRTIELRYFLAGLSDREKATDTLLEQMRFYLKNKELDELLHV